MTRLHHAIETHPTLGWLGSLVALLMSWLAWFIDHAAHFAQIFGLGAALFGFMAGYYTFRIQRRAWQRTHRR